MKNLREADVYHIEIKNEAGEILERYSILDNDNIVMENRSTKKMKYKENLLDLIIYHFKR